ARTFPVLDRECVERDDRQFQTSGGLHDLPHRVDPGAMSLHPRQFARSRPAAVAIHDHGHVPREPLQIDLVDERLFDRARFGKLGEINHVEAMMLALRVSTQYPTGSSPWPAPSNALPRTSAPASAAARRPPVFLARSR